MDTEASSLDKEIEAESNGTSDAAAPAAGDEPNSPRPISKDFAAPIIPPKLELNGVPAPTDSESATQLPRADAGERATSDLDAADSSSREGTAKAALPDVPPRDSASSPPPPPPSHSPAPAAPAVATTAPVAAPSVASASMSRNGSTNGNGNGNGDNRRSSIASTNTVSAPGSSTLVSGILIVSALESIAASKEAKKSKPLKDAVDRALEALKHPTPTSTTTAAGTVDPHLIFAPLQLACETKSLPLMITALDCIGKLLSYDFFVDKNPPRNVPDAPATNDDGDAPPPGAPQDGGEPASFADLITGTVCDCFSPSPISTSSNAAANAATTQHDTLLLRLLSCLLSLILSPALSVHQSSLLKAVRTVYNIFLMGRAGMVQTVAQATLGQIVSGVFSRVSVGDAAASAIASGHANGYGSSQASRNGSVSGSRVDLTTGDDEDDEDEQPTKERSPAQNGTHATEDGANGHSSPELEKTPKLGATATPSDDVEDLPANGTPATPTGESNEEVTLATMESRRSFDGVPEGGPLSYVSTNDLFIKDAFLVFRALCKLSMKPLGVESERDLKSHAMRSKLLSLHLVLSILNGHLAMFVDPNVVIHSSTSRERTPFIQAVKQYLCLALSRNAVSPVIQVFELSCEIFWRVLSGMRTKLKKEIEVLLNEIFLPILEMRNSTVRQKSILLAVFWRLSQDPQALVDIYLNYDCDRSSLDNIYERTINVISKLGTTHFPSTTERPGISTVSAASSSPFPTPGPTLSDDARIPDVSAGQSLESHLKRQSLECLVAVLRSLVSWAARGTAAAAAPPASVGMVSSESYSSSLNALRQSEDSANKASSDTDLSASLSSTRGGGSGTATPDTTPSDDPSRFENAKQRKTTLLEGIKKFNFKPKRGIAFLVDTGFIKSHEPKEIAAFLLNADGLDKAQIGEYLGEGDADNIATMHAFVDYMDFSSTPFVDALRMFLQSFRLPGEAQKIDRYMLKFAERYTAGNPGVFANADTAYILAFSVILLNTDAHNPQVKKPMSKQEFVKNNRGIDDGKDLPEDLLSGIYDEINVNEIRMKDEVEAAGPQTATTGIANAIATAGRDLQREAYVWQSEGMANKTEALFRTLVRGQRRGAGRPTEQFYSASHFEHVRPMFEVAWMPILAGISGPLQDSEDIDLITLSLGGFKQAIKIVCLFDLELERNAFVTTLAKFTFLNNLGEMKAKNVEAIKTLLDVAMVDGNYLKGSWREVLTCVSQLERFQLIAQGVDSHSVPELGRKA
ncbi:hypothetical protein RQP46_008377 [Phenoliferia psychrophenolica]